MPASLVFDTVTHSYKRLERPVLDSVSFSIEDGEFVYLLGPSGSGKSTILSLASARIRPDSGVVTAGAIEVSSLARRKVPNYRRLLGHVFQDFQLLPHLSLIHI